MDNLHKKVLDLLPDLIKGTDSKSQAKGWNVPKYTTPWLLKEFGEEVLRDLPRTEGGDISFDDDGRKALLLKFPNHPIISKLPNRSKKDKRLSQLV